MSIFDRPLRLPRLRPYVPNPNDPAIFWFNSERDDIIREVTKRMVTAYGTDRRSLELVLNEVAFHEAKRLEMQRDEEAREALGYWRSLLRRVAKMSDSAKQGALQKIAYNMAKDIAGNFDPRVYNMATKLAPQMLAGAMSPGSLPRDLAQLKLGHSALDNMIRYEGNLEHLRKLQKIGTLVYVPTHSSNLDSLAFGYSLFRCGLSPLIYGAGKNLFTNPIISFFMHNLGAYRVDRRVKSKLYKDTLKTYSCVMIERGYHSLFFPGGTRSRSGMIERKLKLGLAGSGVEAFSRNQVFGIQRPVWFVPATINYALVMEGETLIEDYLKDSGKAQYIIEDDEFSRVDRWVSFFRKLRSSQSACVVRFGPPLDPFCNPVDENGRSIVPGGRTIDAGTYVQHRGKPTLDGTRDATYTRELGECLLEHYTKDTVLMSTNLVAHVLFRRLVRDSPNVNLFGRMRFRGETRMTRAELVEDIGTTRDRAVELERRGEVRVSKMLRQYAAEDLLDRALAAWDGYHKRLVARTSGPNVIAEDPALLLYYQNRCVDYAEALASEEDHPAAREIALMGARR